MHRVLDRIMSLKLETERLMLKVVNTVSSRQLEERGILE